MQIDPPPAERPRLDDLEATTGDPTVNPDETTIEFPVPDFSNESAGAPSVEAGGTAAAEEETPPPGDEPLAAAAEPETEEGGMFDLAAELRDVIQDSEADEGRAQEGFPATPPSTVEEGFESIFADFKQGVSATLDNDDYETRYDLGIAYREMELYADAIGEFQRCLESPVRKISSLHMMGLCALDLGQPMDAANHLQQALASEELSGEHHAGLQFDLGRALEAADDAGRARSAYQAALDVDPDFPGVAERLARLEDPDAGGTPALACEDEDGSFESFDDLMADTEGEGEAAAPAEEMFETFDDVLTEADGSFADADPSDGDPGPGPGAEPPSEAEATAEPEPKPRRRKKISFV